MYDKPSNDRPHPLLILKAGFCPTRREYPNSYFLRSKRAATTLHERYNVLLQRYTSATTVATSVATTVATTRYRQ